MMTVARIDCWEDTKQRCASLPVPPPSMKVYYQTEFPYSRRYNHSNIQFFDRDAIDLGLELAAENPLILNLSDDQFAGGCVDQGSGAQEESLFRRTNYFQTLTDEFYPIKYGEAVYSPNVSVIKTSERTGWQPCADKGQTVCFVACPAIKYPQTTETRDGERRLSNKDARNLKIQICTIIQCALAHGHDTVIFGAMGCGAWNNPSKHVAEIFRETLSAMDGLVKNYYFAILTTRGDLAVFNGAQYQMTTVDIFKHVVGNQGSLRPSF
jgi:uncharacterized protein (TIGR02452 family)